MSRRIRPRITDADIRPAKTLESKDIAGDIERFLAAGGAIERPAFRRDFLRKFNSTQSIRRAWVTTPPDLKPNRRGVTNE